MVEHLDLQPIESHPYPALTNRTKCPFTPWPELAEGAVVHFTSQEVVDLGDGMGPHQMALMRDGGA